MASYKFNLREIQPSDSAGLTKLITEFDGDLTTRFLVDPYQAIVYGTEFRTTGVVVEAEGYNGFVGMGTVRFCTSCLLISSSGMSQSADFGIKPAG